MTAVDALKAEMEKALAAEQAAIAVLQKAPRFQVIDCVNESTVLSDADCAKYVAAVQTQITRDFFPLWGIGAKLNFISRGGKPSANAWWVIIADTSDQANALGYHFISDIGQPLGYVFAKSDLDYGMAVSVTLSHEILEMLSDPQINLTAQLDQTRFVAFENCDPCLTGDTKIPLLNGTTVPIKELVGIEEFWLYSFGPDGKPHPGRGHSARLTRKDAKILEVELDNGKTVKCTPDHLFMLRDGTYLPASELTAGTSLMPLYRHKTSGNKSRFQNGYWKLLDNSTKRWVYVHVAASEVYSPIPHGWVRHHIDYNKENNDPRNLQPMSWQAHQELHQRVFNDPIIKAKRTAGHFERRGRRLNKTKEAIQRSSAGLRRYNGSEKHLTMLKALWSDPDRRQELLLKTIHSPSARQKVASHNAKRFKQLNATPEHREMLAALSRTPQNRERTRQLALKQNHRRWHLERGIVNPNCALCSASKQEALAEPQGTNHKVIAVRNAGTADVYDLTVDKWNNFAVAAGVVVHNCEADRDGYQIDGVLVSDFVLPAYFSLGVPGPYDFRNLLHLGMPALRPDGYLSIYVIGQGWTQIDAATNARMKMKAVPHVGSRRQRRTTPRKDWVRSEVAAT